MDRYIAGRTDGRIDGQVYSWMDRCIAGWIGI